jgi:PLP dependent protein
LRETPRVRIPLMPAMENSISKNVQAISERIEQAAARSGRLAADVTLIAVSKTVPAEDMRIAWAAGLRHFGENRVQERESKRAALADLDCVWHLIGKLQSNKVRRAVRLFQRIDSVDSLAMAERVDKMMRELASEEMANSEAGKRQMPVLLEALLGEEESKSGLREEQLRSVAETARLLPHIELRGLMGIPPFQEDPEQVRPYFRRLARLRDTLASELGVALPTLSMGMSHDFEVAIEEGATEVRVGTAIFGARVKP